MDRQVNIYEAKTRLSQLVQEVAGGEEIVIARAGKPVAKLVPYRPPVAARRPGEWRGRVRIDPDFDVLSPELEAAFRGEAD
jgi:prevent-host-death family protein